MRKDEALQAVGQAAVDFVETDTCVFCDFDPSIGIEFHDDDCVVGQYLKEHKS